MGARFSCNFRIESIAKVRHLPVEPETRPLDTTWSKDENFMPFLRNENIWTGTPSNPGPKSTDVEVFNFRAKTGSKLATPAPL